MRPAWSLRSLRRKTSAGAGCEAPATHTLAYYQGCHTRAQQYLKLTTCTTHRRFVIAELTELYLAAGSVQSATWALAPAALHHAASIQDCTRLTLPTGLCLVRLVDGFSKLT